MWQWWQINNQFIVEYMFQKWAGQNTNGFISAIKMQEIEAVGNSKGGTRVMWMGATCSNRY